MYGAQGINGQFSIPSPELTSFQSVITSAHPSFKAINYNIGGTSDHNASFKRLSVKVRQFILTDGLGLEDRKFVDWRDSGEELPAEQWHEEVRGAMGGRGRGNASGTILLGA